MISSGGDKLSRVTIVENFAPDRQESMRRFAEMLESGLQRQGVAFRAVAPRKVFTRLVRSYRFDGLPKWFGYIDKLLVFPRALRRMDRHWGAAGENVFHIVDHSNAAYARSIKRGRSLVTCHDLLAVRGALGDASVDCPASRMGRILQGDVLRGLKAADHVACVSSFTRGDLLRLAGDEAAARSSVVLNGINHGYAVIPREAALARVARLDPRVATEPFVMHVGSNLPRKNKRGVIEAVGEIKDSWQGNVVLCGPPIPVEERARAAELSIADRLVEVVDPDNDTLEALYNLAHAFVFPSSSEGFGWPVIEAQACGCPVICSDRTAIPEVAGDAAVVCALSDTRAMGEAIIRLQAPDYRSGLVKRGLANIARFASSRMVDDYLDLYERLRAR